MLDKMGRLGFPSGLIASHTANGLTKDDAAQLLWNDEDVGADVVSNLNCVIVQTSFEDYNITTNQTVV